MNKVLLISLNFFPEKVGIAKYSYELAKWLESEGYIVDVITAVPTFPAWKLFDNFKNKFQKESINKINIYYIPVFIPNNLSFINRLLHNLTFCFGSIIIFIYLMIKNIFNYKFFLTVAPSIIASFFPLLICKLLKIRSVLHFQDLEIDVIKKNIPTPLYYFLKIFEFLCIKLADKTTTISESMVRQLKLKKDYSVFPNWVDFSKTYQLDIKKNRLFFFDKLKKYDTFDYSKVTYALNNSHKIILYSGSIGKKQNFEKLIDILLADKSCANLHYLFCAEGGGVNSFIYNTKDCNNITWIPLQPDVTYNILLNIADLQIIPQDIIFEDLVLPSKLITSLAVGLPSLVFATENSDIYKISNNCGYTLTPGNYINMPAKIQSIFRNEEIYNSKIINSLMYSSQNFEYNNVISTWIKFVMKEGS
jgi:colanic acid biosynthesis glycosyl transferase WcaI